MEPLITVITATRNRIDLLRHALQSVAAQTFHDFEAIVVDDGSDEPVQVQYETLFSELPANFRLHRARAAGAAGSGPGAARNLGISLARGEYVAFLDDDDLWIRPDHLSVAADAVRANNADFFFANMHAVRNGAVVSSDWFERVPELTSGPIVHPGGQVHALSPKTIQRVAMRQGAHPDGWVVRRSILRELDGFWKLGAPAEDYELFTRILDRASGVLYRPVPAVSYRLPEGDAVSLKFTRLEEHLQIARNALHIRATCRTRWALRCSRAQESWHLRQIAQLMLDAGRFAAARSFAWHAVLTYPTLGGMALAARTVVQSVTHPRK